MLKRAIRYFKKQDLDTQVASIATGLLITATAFFGRLPVHPRDKEDSISTPESSIKKK